MTVCSFSDKLLSLTITQYLSHPETDRVSVTVQITLIQIVPSSLHSMMIDVRLHKSVIRASLKITAVCKAQIFLIRQTDMFRNVGPLPRINQTAEIHVHSRPPLQHYLSSCHVVSERELLQAVPLNACRPNCIRIVIS
jgi:hypothetical protein